MRDYLLDRRDPCEALDLVKGQLRALQLDLKESTELNRETRLHWERSLTQIEYLVRSTNYIPMRNRQPTSIKTLLTEVINEKRSFRRHQQKIKFFFDSHIKNFLYLSNREELKQSISLLLDNAIEATTSAQEIYVRTTLSTSHVRIEVMDAGKGIPSNQLDRVFTKGFSFEKTGASGLGLYLCKKIIQRLRGKIKIASKQQLGTRVRILLPLSSFELMERKEQARGGSIIPLIAQQRLQYAP